MIIVLNGPLGIGKTTLAELLSERIEHCAMIDGDHLAAVNPAPADPVDHLHSAIVLLVEHHRRHAYDHFIINHLWTSPSDLRDLYRRLSDLDEQVACFRLVLDRDANLSRIARRASARVVDEGDYERATYRLEHDQLSQAAGDELGRPLDASGTPDEIADALLARLTMEHSGAEQARARQVSRVAPGRPV